VLDFDGRTQELMMCEHFGSSASNPLKMTHRGAVFHKVRRQLVPRYESSTQLEQRPVRVGHDESFDQARVTSSAILSLRKESPEAGRLREPAVKCDGDEAGVDVDVAPDRKHRNTPVVNPQLLR
jgi:hypothetical protein